jgi:O-antigen/teichoic acid export membrane protein
VILRRITKNISWLLLGNILSQGIVFVAIIRAATILPYQEFGIFAFAQAIINFFTRFTEFGLETVAVRKATRDNEAKHLFEYITGIRLSLSTVIIILITAFFFIDDRSNDALILVVLSLSMIGISLSSEWYFLASEKMHIVAVVRTVRAAIFYIPLEFLLTSNPSGLFVSSVYSLSFISIHLIILIVFITAGKVAYSQITVTGLRDLARESFPIGLSSTMMQIPYYFGTFIIGILLTKEDVAKYSAAYRPILAFWSFGIMALYNAIFPIMNNFAKHIPTFSSFILSLTKIFIAGAILLIALVYPLSDTILTLLYQGKYTDSSYVFELSLIIVAIVLSRTAIEYSLLSMQLQKYYTWGIFIVSVLYIVMGTLGGIFYGIQGVIVSSILSEMLYTAYLILQVKRYDDKVFYFPLFSKGVFVLFIILSLAGNPFDLHPMANGVLQIALAIPLIFVLRIVSFKELKNVVK